MALPTVDLGWTYKSEVNGTGNYTLWDQKHRYQQAKPFDLILPYERIVGTSRYFQGNVGSPYDARTVPSWSHEDMTDISALAYERLRNAIYERVSLGVDLVEARQSINMIATTVSTLVKATREIKRFRFGDAAATLRMKFLPRGVSKQKSMANNWLEFHFGWSPLIRDIYDAANVLNDPLKRFERTKRKAGKPFSYDVRNDYGTVWGFDKAVCDHLYYQGVSLKSADLATTHTLDQFGLLNPYSLAWEVVPFSFVVDWFVSVGDYLSSLTDFAGMTLIRPYRGFKLTINTSQTYQVKPGVPGGPYYTSSAINRYSWNARAVGISGPSISVKSWKPPSVTRAATAISLLLQQWRG